MSLVVRRLNTPLPARIKIRTQVEPEFSSDHRDAKANNQNRAKTNIKEQKMIEQEQTLQNYQHYITMLFAPEDDILRSTREEMQRQGLRAMNVSASEGKLLHLLARNCQN
jgi:hypothetical protein